MEKIDETHLDNHTNEVKEIVNNMSSFKDFLSEWQIYMKNIVDDLGSLAKLVKHYDFIEGDIKPINIEKQMNLINKIIEKHNMFVDDVENNKQRLEIIKKIISDFKK